MQIAGGYGAQGPHLDKLKLSSPKLFKGILFIAIMKGFPNLLIPDNIHHFAEYRQKRILGYLRTHILEEMWKPSVEQKDVETSAARSWQVNLTNINLGSFNMGWKIDKQLVDIVADELRELGWNISMGYGDTMLFISVPGDQTTGGVACRTFE